MSKNGQISNIRKHFSQVHADIAKKNGIGNFFDDSKEKKIYDATTATKQDSLQAVLTGLVFSICHLPLSCADNPFFKAITNDKIGSRRLTTSTSLSAASDAIFEELKSRLFFYEGIGNDVQGKKKYVAISSDLWKSSQNECHILECCLSGWLEFPKGVILADINLDSQEVPSQTAHTANNLKDFILQSLKRFQINETDIAFLTVDGDPKMQAIKHNLRRAVVIWCVKHRVSKMTERVVNSHLQLKKLKKLLKYFTQSTKNSSVLSQTSKVEKKIVKYCKTRFNTIFLCLQSIFQHSKEKIQLTLAALKINEKEKKKTWKDQPTD